MQTWRLTALTFSALGLLFLSACSAVAPKPALSVERTQLLREDTGAVRVGDVQAGKDSHDRGIGLRGASMKSPYGSYTEYLREALTMDLKEAGRLDPSANLEVGGELLANDMHIGGFVTGRGEISARFTVKRGGEVRYDAVKSVELTWDSHFVGGIAVDRAMSRYPELVGKLLVALYSDSAFLAAIKP